MNNETIIYENDADYDQDDLNANLHARLMHRQDSMMTVVIGGHEEPFANEVRYDPDRQGEGNSAKRRAQLKAGQAVPQIHHLTRQQLRAAARKKAKG